MKNQTTGKKMLPADRWEQLFKRERRYSEGGLERLKSHLAEGKPIAKDPDGVEFAAAATIFLRMVAFGEPELDPHEWALVAHEVKQCLAVVERRLQGIKAICLAGIERGDRLP